MLSNKQTATLLHGERIFDVHVIEIKQDYRRYGPTTFDIKASEIIEVTKPFPAFVAKRQELIDFAKTGAPPALPRIPFDWLVPLFYLNEGNVSDAAWVDNSPTYSSVLAARDEKYPTRCVPRMVDQGEWLHQKETSIYLEPGPHICMDAEDSSRLTKGKRYDITGFKNGYVILASDDRYAPSGGWCQSRFRPVPVRKRPESPAQFALDFHASNQRWWTDLHTGEKITRNMGEMIMIVTSEIAEAMEGKRKDLMDDHLPHRKMAEVELADAIIRIADIVGSMGRAASTMFERRLDYIKGETFVPENKGEALNRICNPLAAISPNSKRYEFTVNKFARVWHRIERYAAKHGYDLWGAVFEKMDYNTTRKDHTPEARKAANGKKF
jgi:hypothetical protein